MIYVCSDLHGYSPVKFQKLLDQTGFTDGDFLFVLGDVIDRGEWGAELLLWLTQQSNMELILGNHEALMLACSFLFEEVNEQRLDSLSLREISMIQDWIDNGGGATLKGLKKLLHKDPELVYGILDYLQEASLFEKLEVNGQKYILVHSGLGNFEKNRPLDDYTPEELLLERPSMGTQYYSDARVIFGHTPSVLFGDAYAGRPVHTNSWSCIDMGVAMGYLPMLLRLDDMKEFYLYTEE